MDGLIDCTIIAPDSKVFSGPVRHIVVSDHAGQMQLLPGHAEIFVALVAGAVTVRRQDGAETSFPAESGVLHYKDGVAKIVL